MDKTISIYKENFRICANEFNKLNHKEFNNLHIIDSLGDIERMISLIKELLLLDNELNLLTIRCEDTYLHLLKKLVMSMKYLLSTYDIQEGILRLGDDISIIEDHLEHFLVNIEKTDYMGWTRYKYPNNEEIKKYVNWFMANHYITHLSELPDISMSQEQIRKIILI